MAKSAPRAGRRWAEEIFTALGEQSVVVTGTGAAAVVLPQLAAQLAQLRTSRAEVLTQVEAIVEAHPLHEPLTSLPAVGIRTAARIITEVVGKEFKTAGHLGSYAGLAPVTWRAALAVPQPAPANPKIAKRGPSQSRRRSPGDAGLPSRLGISGNVYPTSHIGSDLLE